MGLTSLHTVSNHSCVYCPHSDKFLAEPLTSNSLTYRIIVNILKTTLCTFNNPAPSCTYFETDIKTSLCNTLQSQLEVGLQNLGDAGLSAGSQCDEPHEDEEEVLAESPRTRSSAAPEGDKVNDRRE